MPLLPRLPDPDGPYAVGATTFLRTLPRPTVIGESRVLPLAKHGPKRVEDAALGGDDNDENAFEPTLILEEIAFTAFYPVERALVEGDSAGGSWFGWGKKGLSKGMDWVIKPVDETLKGYEHFGGPFSAAWMSALLC
jgi:platelet-activating factor acetylhydrolase